MKHDEMNISNVEISRTIGFGKDDPDYYEAELTIYGRFVNYNDAHNTVSAIVNVLTAGSIPADQPGPASVDEPMTGPELSEAIAEARTPSHEDAYPADEAVDPPREPGKPSLGRKRRTKAEMTEDRETDEAAGEDPTSAPGSPEGGADEAPARLGRSKPSKEGNGRANRPTAPDAPEEEPEISDHDMYAAAGHGAAVLGPETVSKVLDAFEVKRAGDIDQQFRQQFLDEIKNCIAAMSS